MKKRLLPLLFAFVAAVGIYLLLRPHRDSGDWLYGSGVIEATEVDVSAEVAGKLLAMEATEGRSISEGDRIADIQNDDYQAQLQQAQGNLKAAEGDVARAEAVVSGERLSLLNARTAYQKSTELKGRYEQAQAQYEAALAAQHQAQANLDLVRAGARDEQIRQARAAVVSSQAQWQNTRRELRRLEVLVEQGAVSEQQLDLQRSAEKAARGTRDAAEARLAELEAGARTEEERKAEAALAQAKANTIAAKRSLETSQELYEDRLELKQRLDAAEAGYQAARNALRAAEGRLESARGALATAEKRLRDTTIEAPMDGVVLLKLREPGETVNPGQPIVRLGDLANMWLRVYVAETEINRVKLGQKAEVAIDASPDKVFEGQITEIAQQAEFTPKNVQTREQRTKLVFGVKISVENPNQELKPGMPADARIKAGGVD